MSTAEPSRARESREPATRGDLVSGVVSSVFGAAVLLLARGFPELPDGAPGPGLFPTIIGALFVLFGLVLVVRYVKDRTSSAEVQGQARADEFESLLDEPVSPRTAWINALSVLGSVVFYLLVADSLGFSLTMAILLVALMWRLGTGLRTAVPSALGTTVVMYLLFERVLLVPLPTGILG